MNTSLLYHGFGIQHQEVLKTEYKHGKVYVKVKTKESKLQCSNCQGWNFIKAGVKDRLFKTLPIGGKPVYILAALQRLECKICGMIRQEHIQYAESKKTYTHSFRRYALELSRIGTIQDVANHLQISWDVVKEIQKEYLQAHYGKPDIKNVQRIAIDEFAVKKGHNYMTVVLDLDTGIVIHVGDGKGVEALTGFWERVKRNKVKIQAVAIDMSPSYIAAVMENLPEAKLVFDHFHIVKMLNDELSELRRELYTQETSLNKKILLKGTRWLLLKNSENLNAEKNEEKRLQRALDINKPLAIAYYLKEDLGLLWEQQSRKEAEEFLNQWVEKARASKIFRLQKFAGTLLAHKFGILNWFDFPISTGPLEGINNKIKVLKRQAYGFRDSQFFKLKIYALHETTYALVG